MKNFLSENLDFYKILALYISSLVSIIVAQLYINIKLKNIYSTFGNKLYKEKIKVYPILYELISSFIKKQGTLTLIDIEDFRNKLDELDSKYGIFFSSSTVTAFYNLRTFIYQLLVDLKSKKITLEEINDYNFSNKYYQYFEKAELALKFELGSHAFASPTDYNKSKLYNSYREGWSFKRKFQDTMKKIKSVFMY
ncbi:hypothetical protein [Caminibacter sp.]